MNEPKGALLRLIFLALFAIAVSYLFISNLDLKKVELGFPLDDSWIHYVYARNAADGKIFVYNAHERVIGSTSPLWVCLVVPAFWLSDSHTFHIWWGIILGIIFHFLTGVIIYFVMRRYDEVFAFLTALCVSTTGRLVWASVSGMETSLFYFLCVASVVLAARVKDIKKSALPLGIILALTAYARPEGLLLAALVLLWLSLRWDEKKFVFEFLISFKAGLIFAMLVLPYIVYTYLTWGHPFPTTFYSKRLIISQQPLLGDWLKTVFSTFLVDNVVMVLAAFYGIYALLIGRTSDKKLTLAFFWIISLTFAQAYFSNLSFHHGRYQMPLVPFLWMLAGFGLFELAKALEARGLKFFGISTNQASALIFCTALLINVGDLAVWRNIYAENVKSVNLWNVGMGRYIRDNVPYYATVAVNDVGAIRYFGEHDVLDLMGIASPEVINIAHEKGIKPYRINYVREMARLILKKDDVDYVAVFDGWFPFQKLFPEAFLPLYSVGALSVEPPHVWMVKTLYRVDKSRLREYLKQ